MKVKFELIPGLLFGGGYVPNDKIIYVAIACVGIEIYLKKKKKKEQTLY